jgi:heat shock protein HtpX
MPFDESFPLNALALYRHKVRNLFQTLLLVGGLGLLLGYLAWVIGGIPFAIMAFAVVLFSFAFNPMLSPRLILRLFRGRELRYEDAPRLYLLFETLAERAGLEQVPQLFYIPSDVMNAFSTGTRGDAAVALSDGLLRRLSLREIAGVLAHEVAHVRNNDIRVMGFADMMGQLTRLLSFLGQFLLILNLPLWLFSYFPMDWLPILVLILAPSGSALIQLALSRNREYEADLGAAQLTGDPEGLAEALEKMDWQQSRLLSQLLLPGQRLPEPSLLRSHPPAGERVRRLLGLRGRPAWEEVLRIPLETAYGDHHVHVLASSRLRPRWHRSGLWY